MNNYIPTYVYLSIYDIDFNKLYADGKRIIISDLDNTLLPYYEPLATNELKEWKNKLDEIGFKFYIITNNNDKRIKKLISSFEIDGYLTKAKKPSPKRLLKYLSDLNIKLNEVIFLGDQLVTDIKCANKAGIDNILVKTIDSYHQKWYTKINRLREIFILRKMKKIDLEKAEAILKFKEKN